MTNMLLRVDGAVESPVDVCWDDLCAFPDDDRVDDVSTLNPHRQGSAVRLSAVLDIAKPKTSATHVTLHASTDGFSANLPIDAVRDVAVLIYSIDGQPLSANDGGPIRFLIPNAAPCKTADLDACANVKHLDRIEFTTGPEPDSRG